MWRLCCTDLFLIIPSFGALGRLCFVIMAFPEFLHLCFFFFFFFFFFLAKLSKRCILSLEDCVIRQVLDSSAGSEMKLFKAKHGKELMCTNMYGKSSRKHTYIMLTP